MGRREFITLAGGAAVAWPHAIFAQQLDRMRKKLPVIGVLNAGMPSQPSGGPLYDAFLRGLRENGYVVGENLIIERRFWQGDQEQLPKAVAELVADGVDLIVAPSTIEALAAKRATNTIPIVFNTPADPVGVGLADSWAHPGGNATGLSATSGDTRGGKGIGWLAELVPEASRYAVLMDPGNPTHKIQLSKIDTAAAQLHLEIVPVVERSADDIGPAFETMAAKGVQALVVLSDPITFQNTRRIMELAAQNRLPVLGSWREEAIAGALITYSSDLSDLWRRSADYIAKLLQGAKAAELPIEQPTRLHLIINLKTASALGLKVPTSLLATADEVIE
jgi:putative ABC transport system substrate-binding protein